MGGIFQKSFNARWNTLFSWSGNYCAKIIIWYVTVKLSKTTSIYHMFYQIDFSSISFHMCFQKSVLNKRGGWKIFWIWINGVAGIRMSRVDFFSEINKRPGPFIRDSRVYFFQNWASNILSTFLSETSVFWGIYMQTRSRDFLFQFEGAENK